METGHVIQALFLLFSCVLLVSARSRDAQDAAMNDVIHSQASQPQKRSVPDLSSGADDADLPAIYSANGIMDDFQPLSKRSSLFRFGKRGGSLFRFGKRGSLFRFGKRSSLFRFGKRGGALFRFGKRASHDDDVSGDYVFYPSSAEEMPAEDLKREVKSFHWGRETEE